MDKITMFFTELMRKYLPDPFVFALGLTYIAAFLAVVVEGKSILEVTNYWGNGFWNLLTFTCQVVITLAMGYVMAIAPPTEKLMDKITSLIHTPTTAIIVATLVGGVGSYLNWAFGLVVGGIIAKKLALKVRGVHYPLIIAAAYSGFTLYGLGFSATIPVLISTEGHPMAAQMGVIPLSDTIFHPVMLATSLVVIITLPLLNAFLQPRNKDLIIEVDPNIDAADAAKISSTEALEVTLASKFNNSRIMSMIVCAMALTYIVMYFTSGKGLNLNVFNFIFLFTGIFLMGTPSRYVAKLVEGVKTTSGIILQYPFYAGIMAIMGSSGLMITISDIFMEISTPGTLPFWGLVSSFFINFFAPSGGGHWVIQGPFMVEAANALSSSLAQNSMAVMLGNAWNDLIQPFWILPALAISKLKLKDVMGYTVISMFWVGIIYLGVMYAWGVMTH